jgi:hypothetical protein
MTTPMIRRPLALLALFAAPALACGLRANEGHAAPSATPSSAPGASSVASASSASTGKLAKVLARARLEVTRQVDYDPAYQVTTYRDGKDTGKAVYPGGDVEPKKGVCTDVVVRSLRAADLDLQKLVHEAALAHPAWFPTIKAPDANIDHRRVPALTGLFDHVATRLPTGTATAQDRATFQPGDLVVWSFDACPKCSPRHIGVVSDRKRADGLPLVIHNLGPHPTEDDVLDDWTMLRHYRVLGVVE